MKHKIQAAKNTNNKVRTTIQKQQQKIKKIEKVLINIKSNFPEQEYKRLYLSIGLILRYSQDTQVEK